MDRITYKTLNELESRAPTPEELTELRRGYACFLDRLGRSAGAEAEVEALAKEIFVLLCSRTKAVNAFEYAREFITQRAFERGRTG
jgi:hypothetical protein